MAQEGPVVKCVPSLGSTVWACLAGFKIVLSDRPLQIFFLDDAHTEALLSARCKEGVFLGVLFFMEGVTGLDGFRF
jgi:hypothetical protein